MSIKKIPVLEGGYFLEQKDVEEYLKLHLKEAKKAYEDSTENYYVGLIKFLEQMLKDIS